MTYPKYLKVDELLSLQHPLSKPEHPDELLFIVVHQASELWFKLILHELDRLTTLLAEADVLRSMESLNRINGLMHIVTTQLHALDTLSPQRFSQFRTFLGSSSGSQSVQFRAIELISGLRDPGYMAYLETRAPHPPVVQEAIARPCLPELFDRLLAARGVEAAALYSTDDHLELRMLAEGFLQYEQTFGIWRFLHVQMVERILGPDTGGTGGSLGAKALRETLNNRFFNQLWAVRARFF